MKGRRPRKDELELWSQVARSARRLHRGQRGEPIFPARGQMGEGSASESPSSQRGDPEPLPRRFRVGGAAAPPASETALPASVGERLSREPVRMDAKAYGRLKRGKLVPDARLDLHGMTLDRAHGALVGFILQAQGRGHRLVLVITGKGGPPDPYAAGPQRRGVLKVQVPQWLRLPPLAQAVLQISEAHIRHGGAGAYYVYLRKAR